MRRFRNPIALCLLAIALVLTAGPCSAAESSDRSWSEIVSAARGQTVDWFLWGGWPETNAYVTGFVADEMAARYGVRVRQVPVRDIAEVVGRLLVEKQAGKTSGGEADLLWINGENFRTAKAHGLLHGPFADRLPHTRLVDWDQPSVKNDFGVPVEGMESPWGSAQIVFIFDTRRTPEPPGTMGELLDWIRAHPGRFAYPAPPDFTGSAFVRQVFYHVAGPDRRWGTGSDPAAFDRAAKATFKVLREIAPALWREGKTYPESPIRVSRLFADGEVDFSMSYHPAEASKKIHDGLFPDTVRTFVLDGGTLANTHFVAIPFNSADREGAMVLADFLLSPEAQLKKADPRIWGDLPAIDLDRLDPEWRQRFADLPRGVATLPPATLQAHRIPELPSEFLVALERGWERHVLKGR